ncbi:MAG TPA: ABC transporter permease subunit, partial [Candidatus Polarisedimenticolaceae bacterium]|nr:ABC transporter permease subunit [Candidatus Polarisedimenticolaceae bacterium]
GLDALLALPRLVLLLVLGTVLRPWPAGVGLAIGLASWMGIARLVDAEARRILARPFYDAARSSGGGGLRAGLRHLTPNLGPVLGAAAPHLAAEAILLESTLSFLGVGAGSSASWGSVVADGQRLLPAGWWLATFPGLLLCAAALAVHGLRGRDPRTRGTLVV